MPTLVRNTKQNSQRQDAEEHPFQIATCMTILCRQGSPKNNKEHQIGTPEMFTTTGLGPRKNREMAGVDDLVVYMLICKLL